MKFVILGAGDHGRILLDLLLERGDEVIGFVDDDPSKQGIEVEGIPVVGDSSILPSLKRMGVAVALGVGNNEVRARLFKMACEAGLPLPPLIHPRAVVSKRAHLGEAVVVLAGAVVNIGAEVEENVCINTAALVDHDNKIGAHVHIFPGARLTGGVKVGEFSYIGSGAVILPYVKIGRNVTVGAGAVVIRDLPDHCVAVGVPAKVKRFKNPSQLGRLR